MAADKIAGFLWLCVLFVVFAFFSLAVAEGYTQVHEALKHTQAAVNAYNSQLEQLDRELLATPIGEIAGASVGN